MGTTRDRRGKRQAEIIALRQRISELLLSGASERQIASATGKAASTVHYHVSALLRQWREATDRNINQWVARALAEFAVIEREAWVSWNKSKQPQRTKTVRARGIGHRTRRDRPIRVDGATLVEISQKVQITESAGNPEFLSIILQVIERRSRLLGLNGSCANSPPPSGPTSDIYSVPRAKLIEAITRRP
jgi:hypothetical protein